MAIPVGWQLFTCDFPFRSVRIICSEFRTCNKERGIDRRLHICRVCVEEQVILILSVLVFLGLRGYACLIIAKFVLVVRISSEITYVVLLPILTRYTLFVSE